MIGKAEAIDGKPFVVACEEDACEVANQVSVRRVKFITADMSKPISDTTSRKIQMVSPEVPSHLENLYHQTFQNLDTDQKQRVAELLHRFQVFPVMNGI